MKKIFLIAVTGILLASCANNQAEKKVVELTVEQLKKEEVNLMETNRNWEKSASPEEFFSFINSDALLMAPDISVVKGHKGIGEVLKGFQSLPGFKISWEPQEVFVSKAGDLGYSVDRILVNYNDKDGNTVDLFEKGVTIWKKNAKNEWKMSVDIWNVDKTINSIYK
jgi:ketosteroid isomerase-like protein